MRAIFRILLVLVLAFSLMSVLAQGDGATEEPPAAEATPEPADDDPSSGTTSDSDIDNEWILQMFVVSVVGSLIGLLWPKIVEKVREILYGQQIRDNETQYIFRYIGVVIIVLIASIVLAALGFATFLQSEETRMMLRELGVLGYFSAFTYGFTSASAAEEFLKKD